MEGLWSRGLLGRARVARPGQDKFWLPFSRFEMTCVQRGGGLVSVAGGGGVAGGGWATLLPEITSTCSLLLCWSHKLPSSLGQALLYQSIKCPH